MAGANIAQAAYPPTNIPNECCMVFKEQDFEGGPGHLFCNDGSYESLLPDDFRENIESWACGPGTKVEFCEEVDGECKTYNDESEYAASSKGRFWNASMGRANLINRVFVSKANETSTTIYEGLNCTGSSARLEFEYGQDNDWKANLERQGIDKSTQFRSIMMAPKSFVRWEGVNWQDPKIIQ